MGVKLVPAMPAFYQKPRSINDLVDFVVGRVLEENYDSSYTLRALE